MKLIFMGTPDFAVPALEALIESPHEVAAVYSQPPRSAGRGQKLTPGPVYQLAERHGIPIFTPTSLKGEEEQAQFAAIGADLAVVAAYGLLLPKAILDAPRLGCINIHPSLLPRWRGAAPIQRTVLAGDRETGVCIMQMDEGLDTGPVLLCERTPVGEAETSGRLHDRLAAMGAALTLKAVDRLAGPGITPEPQAAGGVTYAAKIQKSEARIQWDRPAAEVLCHIRGFNPFPGAFFECHGEIIKVLEAEAVTLPKPNIPGYVIDKHLTIACRDHAIRPALLQRPGKKPVALQDFLNGMRIPDGTFLEPCPAIN